MRVRHAGNLRQMRDAEDLSVQSDHGDAFGDHARRLAADARVDLVEDHARRRIIIRGRNSLDGESHA